MTVLRSTDDHQGGESLARHLVRHLEYDCPTLLSVCREMSETVGHEWNKLLPNRCPISRSECRRFVCGELHRTNDPIGHGGLGSNDHCRIERSALPDQERQRPSITFPGLSRCTSSTASNEPPNWGLIEAIESNLALQASLLLYCRPQ